MSKLSNNNCTLVLMCKRPKLGISKQRVAETTSSQTAFELSELLVDCAMADLAQWQGPVAIAVADKNDIDWATQHMPNAKIVSQATGNLGQRIEGVAEQLRHQADRCLYIGIDAPTLDHSYLAMAASALDVHDIVLGAADDGGVVVMGNRRSWPSLQSLPWSTPKLGEALAIECQQAGLSVEWLPSHSDIDHANQFLALHDLLVADGRPSRIALTQWLNNQLDLGRKTMNGIS